MFSSLKHIMNLKCLLLSSSNNLGTFYLQTEDILTQPFPNCIPWNTSNIISVQFSHSVVSDSLWPHGLQHARLPCPSPTPGACSNSCPLSQWFHPMISTSVIPFSSCLQSFPASGSFPMSQLLASGGQSIGVSSWNNARDLRVPSYISWPVIKIPLLFQNSSR